MTAASSLRFKTIADTSGAGSRQAALLLHGIASADREWLLGELAAGQRTLLASLLGELRALGVPSSPALIDDMLAARSTSLPKMETAASGNSNPIESLARRLERVRPAMIAGFLRGEPDALVARVIQCTEAAWHRKVLKHLGALRRRNLERLRRAPGAEVKSAQRLDAAILQALITRASRPAEANGRAGSSSAARVANYLRRGLMRRTHGNDVR